MRPDLMIPADGADPTSLFFSARDITVDSEGNIYVLDAGNHRVQVFDRDGAFLRTLGRSGEGPGEFADPNVMAVSDGFAVVSDATLMRASVWSVAGDHVRDWRYSFPRYLDGMAGVTGPFVLASYKAPDAAARDGSGKWILVRLPISGERHLELARFAVPARPSVNRSVGAGATLGRVVELPYAAGPKFAAGRESTFVVPAGEYRILCLATDGQPRWEVRVDRPRRQVDEQDKIKALASLPPRYADAPVAGINWPEEHPAISHVAVDGHENLHVFLVPSEQWEGPGVPVDVYAPDGSRILTGRSEDLEWTAAMGDHVYALEKDAHTGEQVVRRYWLSMSQ